jgi:hypothetical protein
MISPLELHGIQATLEEVQGALQEMKLVAIKQAKEDQWQDRLQAAREKLASWNGDPATEPKL